MNRHLAICCKLYNKGLSVRKIAKEVGLHHKTVSKYLKQAGIEIDRQQSYEQHRPKKYQPSLISWDTKQERDNLIISMYNEGKSSTYIHRALGISGRTVLRILEKNNIERRFQQPMFNNTQKQSINNLYNQGNSISVIADRYGVCDHTISDVLENIRTPGETMRSFFGQERDIEKLYELGMSSYDIAKELNINNPDAIARYLRSKNLLRSKEEIKKLVAIKLSDRDIKSNIHIAFENILDSMDIRYDSEFPLEGWNFDIHICDTNILFEINGDYWHKLPQRVQRDKRKKKVAENAGYVLYYIWEHQFKNEDIIKSYIDYIINGVSVDFDFSDIIISKSSANNVQQYIKNWHYSNKLGNHNTSYIASYHDKVIAACVFGNIVRKQSATKQGILPYEVLELSRFAIHPKYHKKNFASWFISRCIKKLRVEKPQLKLLISFADSTYNHEGKIYKASNWVFDGKTQPDYWYVDQKRNIIHKKTIWNRAKQEDISETDYAANSNLKKVYGYSKSRYLYFLESR